MKAMISQPVTFRHEEEIIETMNRATKYLESMGFEVTDNIFANEWYKNINIKNIQLCLLAKSLENMSFCDAIYFCKGWEDDQRCIIEHDAAIAYHVGTLYEWDIKEEIEKLRLEADKLEQRKCMVDTALMSKAAISDVKHVPIKKYNDMVKELLELEEQTKHFYITSTERRHFQAYVQERLGI